MTDGNDKIPDPAASPDALDDRSERPGEAVALLCYALFGSRRSSASP
jgi:hypothetical protein